MLELRPHHINCLYFYKGYGYDEEFVKNMNEIASYFNNNNDEKIKLVDRCDDVCRACPNKKEGRCETFEKVKQLDKNTLKEYNLKIGQLYSISDIKKNIYENFSKDKFLRICKDCSWHKEGVCIVK